MVLANNETLIKRDIFTDHSQSDLFALFVIGKSTVLAVIIGSYIEFPRQRFHYENFCVTVRTNITGVAFASSVRVRQPLAPFVKKKKYMYI